MTIRAFLADDQAMVRQGLAMVIEAQEDMRVAGEAGDGAEALARLGVTAADVVLMDVRMRRMDGVEATRRLLARAGEPPRCHRADHVRPRRVRIRGAAGGGERLPA